MRHEDVVAAHALPGALVDLVESRVAVDAQIMQARDGERGLVGPPQRARVDGRDRLLLQGFGQLAGLLAPALVQRDVGTPLPAPLAVPIRLAVATEDDLGHCPSLVPAALGAGADEGGVIRAAPARAVPG